MPGAARHSLPAMARAPRLPLRPLFLSGKYGRSVHRAGEGAAAQVIVGVRLVVHEIGNGVGDLVVDLVILRIDLRIDADVGDDKAFQGRRLQVLGQAGRVLDHKSLQGRTALEDRFHTRGEVLLKRPGGHDARLEEFHAGIRRKFRTRQRISLPLALSYCILFDLMQCADKGLAAQKGESFGELGNDLRDGAGNIGVDLVILLGTAPGIEGDLGDEELAREALAIDVVGKACPMPLIALAREVRTLRPGQTVRIIGNDPIFEESIVQFCREGGHAILETARDGKVVSILIRVRPEAAEPAGRERT